jgi:ubiquinone/menaquinone biosynthesis C-methylase UbiE
LAAQHDLTTRLKQRLCASISAQIDAIGYVPADIAKLVGDFEFDTQAIGEHEMASPTNGADKDSLATRVNGHYDQMFYNRSRILDLVGHDTDFRNIGYWNKTTATQREASELLQDALLAFIPEKSGRILDVACGMGASTRRLLKHYPAENVWAINISEKQINSTRKNAPGCHAQVMNAVEMTFDDGFFDNILCIEAAFHFETRRKFLEEARRILKPGGRLVLSDVLFTSADRLTQYPVFPSPANHLPDADAYRDLLLDVGFSNVIVSDVTKDVWPPHCLNVVNRVHEAFFERKLSIVQLTEIVWTYYQLDAITGACVFVSAQK